MKSVSATKSRAAALTILASTMILVGCGNKDENIALYTSLKNDLRIKDYLSEGKVSYSFFGGDMTVSEPRLSLPLNAYSQQFKSLSDQAERELSGFNVATEEMGRESRHYLRPLAGSIYTSSYTHSAIDLTADELRLSSSGTTQKGGFELSLKGVDLGKPQLTVISGEMLPLWEVGDQLQPEQDIEHNGVFRKQGDYRQNVVNTMPGMGNWIINATGAYGSKADIDVSMKRKSSGEGSIRMVITHTMGSSKLGSITREANFGEMPELDKLVKHSTEALLGLVLASNDRTSDLGVAFVLNQVTPFIRSAHAKDYTVSYEGYKDLKDVYKRAGYAANKGGQTRFCSESGISVRSLVAAPGIEDDSECQVSLALIDKGKYRERYTFDSSKSILSEMLVTRRYTATID